MRVPSSTKALDLRLRLHPFRISWRVSHVAARRVPTLPRRHHPRVDSTTAMCVPPHIARARAFLFRRVNRRALIHHATRIFPHVPPRARARAGFV